jgi:phosphate starvation-inducible protein PhoH
MTAIAAPSSRTAPQKIKDSLVASAGNIVFGMEDGTVSIFGLVFGVAASAPGSHAVLLAGATGAAAAAVSMMAGTYLDVSTANGRAKAEQEQKRLAIEQQTAHEAQNVDTRLNAAGFSDTERRAVVRALEAHPATWLRSRLRSNCRWVMGKGRVHWCNPCGCSLPMCSRRPSRSFHSRSCR